MLTQHESTVGNWDTLNAEMESSQMEQRDRSFARLLLRGVLKNRSSLDWTLERYCSQPLDRMERSSLNVLRLGAFELLHLPDKPAPVIVNEYVNLARSVGHEGMARFTNAVLRRIAESRGETCLPSQEGDPVRDLALRYSHPEWMVARWISRFGAEETETLCRLNNEPPVLCLRINQLKSSTEEVAGTFTEAGIAFRVSSYVPDCLLIESRLTEAGVNSLIDLPGFSEGWFTIQDEASQLATWAVGPVPGETILDVCAAPGGKTTHLSQLMRGQGRIIAIDRSAKRLHSLRENCQRLGVTNTECYSGDFRHLAGEFLEAAEACLVDAPCSGTGVLRRKPDIRWRRQEKDLVSLADLQFQLLAAAATTVRPGGRVIYSTCSIEWEENTEVVNRFLQVHRDFTREPLTWLPHVMLDEEGYLSCLPHRHKTDGGFAARLVRKPG